MNETPALNNWAILGISDLQIPFEHHDAFDFVKHVKKYWIPEGYKIIVVNVGDEFDQHTLSLKHFQDPDGLSGGHEYDEAMLHVQQWYQEFPVKRICTSNHTYRVAKKAYHAGIPQAFMKSIAEAYKAPPGWLWNDSWLFHDKTRDFHLKAEHGENVSGPTAAINAAIQNRMSTMIGHQHSNGGVLWSDSEYNRIFGLNTGCLIDVDAYAFKYGKSIRKKPSLGMGLILNGIPLFIPMFLDKGKRWVGRTL